MSATDSYEKHQKPVPKTFELKLLLTGAWWKVNWSDWIWVLLILVFMLDFMSFVRFVTIDCIGSYQIDSLVALNQGSIASTTGTLESTSGNRFRQVTEESNRAFVITVPHQSYTEHTLIQIESLTVGHVDHDIVVLVTRDISVAWRQALLAQGVLLYEISRDSQESNVSIDLIKASVIQLLQYDEVIAIGTSNIQLVLILGHDFILDHGDSASMFVEGNAKNSSELLHMSPKLEHQKLDSWLRAVRDGSTLAQILQTDRETSQLPLEEPRIDDNLRRRIYSFSILRHIETIELNSYAHCVDIVKGRIQQNMPKLCMQVIPFMCFATKLNNCPNIHAQTITDESPRDTTATVQLSLDRFERLLDLTREWSGPISATIWVPVTEVKNAMKYLIQTIYPRDRVDIHLVVQRDTKPYPINVLRNVAIKNARTDLVFLLDLDFIVSYGFYEKLKNDQHYEHIWENSAAKHAFVIPAFEFISGRPCQASYHKQESQHKGCYQFPTEKKDIKKLISHGSVSRFHSNLEGHLFTNNARWLESAKPYYVHWGEWYEPYLLVRKSQIDFDWFDERFFDRGRNKCIFSFELYARGFRFVVLPHEFVIHHWEDSKVDGYKPMMSLNDYLYKFVTSSLRSQYSCSASRETCAKVSMVPSYGHFTGRNLRRI